MKRGTVFKLIILFFMIVTVVLGIISLQYKDIKYQTDSFWPAFSFLLIWVEWTSIALFLYPLYAFKEICPRQGGFFNAQNPTATVPVTKKRLLLHQLQEWFYLTPVYLLLTIMARSLVRSYLLDDLLQSSMKLYMMTTVILFFTVGFIVAQIIAGSIISLAYQIKGYKIAAGLITLNIIILTLSNLVESISYRPISHYNVMIVASIIISGLSFTKIEKIHQ